MSDLKITCQMVEKRAQEQKQAEEKKHGEEINFLKRTNQQLKSQLEGALEASPLNEEVALKVIEILRRMRATKEQLKEAGARNGVRGSEGVGGGGAFAHGCSHPYPLPLI